MRRLRMRKRMDWRSVNFDWNRLRGFLVVAEEGSYSAAARALNMAQPTLGRQVAALEKELGVVLFERVGRGLLLTDSGAQLVEHARAMGEAAGRISLTATGSSQSLTGTVRITATEIGAAYGLTSAIREIREEEPGIEIEIVADNAIRDLRGREADIALRSARPTDPELIGRKLRDGQGRLYATPEFIERNGPFNSLDALSRADFIGFADNKALINGLNAYGFSLTERNFPIRSASHVVMWEMTKAGLGIGVMAAEIGDEEPLLTRAAPWLRSVPYELWLVAHRELRTSRRVRFVFDKMLEALG